MTETFKTKDHGLIRRWAEQRSGYPATVAVTKEGDNVGLLAIDFPGYGNEGSLEHISWDAFFTKFDQENLIFLFQEQSDSGQPSRYCKFVSDQD